MSEIPQPEDRPEPLSDWEIFKSNADNWAKLAETHRWESHDHLDIQPLPPLPTRLEIPETVWPHAHIYFVKRTEG